MAKPSGHTVADHRVADGLADDESGPGRVGTHDVEMDDEMRTAATATTPHRRRELVPTGEPGPGRQHSAA